MRLFVAAGSLLLAATAARAQSREEPSLAFTISAGLTTGGSLWNIDGQLLRAPGTNNFDTVQLQRRLRPGLTASLAVSYFRSPHWGLNAEVGYFGIGSEQRCSPQAPFATDAENLNQQGCSNANGRHSATSVIGFLAGATYRFIPNRPVQPYLRASAGFGLLGVSYVETVAIVQHSSCVTSDGLCPYPLLSERGRRSATPLFSIAGGFSYNLGPGYRVRMEARDVVVTLPQVPGPAQVTSSGSCAGNCADTRMVWKHVPVVMIGFDVLLERRRSRRY